MNELFDEFEQILFLQSTCETCLCRRRSLSIKRVFLRDTHIHVYRKTEATINTN